MNRRPLPPLSGAPTRLYFSVRLYTAAAYRVCYRAANGTWATMPAPLLVLDPQPAGVALGWTGTIWPGPGAAETLVLRFRPGCRVAPLALRHFPRSWVGFLAVGDLGRGGGGGARGRHTRGQGCWPNPIQERKCFWRFHFTPLEGDRFLLQCFVLLGLAPRFWQPFAFHQCQTLASPPPNSCIQT